LAESFAQLIGDDARGDIRVAARAEWHDDPNRTIRKRR